MFNQVLIVGRLGGDPDSKFTPNGNQVTTFSVATNRTYTNGGGEKKQETEWHRVVAWRNLAEICQRFLKKGRLVLVQGRLQTRSWQDDKGVTHYRTEIVAQTMKILDRKPEGDEPEEVTDEAEETADVELPF